jgi:hypothetical protein
MRKLEDRRGAGFRRSEHGSIGQGDKSRVEDCAQSWTSADECILPPINRYRSHSRNTKQLAHWQTHIHSLPPCLTKPLSIQQILTGQKVTVVRCEEINASGSFFRNKLKYHDYLHSTFRLFPISICLFLISICLFLISIFLELTAALQNATLSTPKSPVLSTTEHPPESSSKPSEEWSPTRPHEGRPRSSDWSCMKVFPLHRIRLRRWLCQRR